MFVVCHVTHRDKMEKMEVQETMGLRELLVNLDMQDPRDLTDLLAKSVSPKDPR